jgi:hypothetical protein
MSEAQVKRVRERLGMLVSARQLHESTWDECYKYTHPQRGAGIQTSVGLTASEYQNEKARIYDDTAADSVRTGTSTFLGSAVPPNAVWAGLEVGGDSEDEKAWLDQAAEFIWKNIHSSNFDAESADAMIDQWIAGWFVMYCEEQEGGGFYFESWPIGQCYIASSKSGSMIDTVARKWEYNVGQCVGVYGIDNVSDTTRQKYHDGKLEDKITICMLIEPRPDTKGGDTQGRLATQLPFASYVIEEAASHLLKESGYHEFPCMAPRWMRLPGSAYATGPVSDCLPSIKTLNEMTKWTLMGAETAIAPALIVANDGVVNARNIKLGPRKIIVADTTDSIKPLMTGADVKTGIIMAESLQSRIRKVLVADQLPPADGPTKTAYEWSVRVQAVRAMMGPMFGRLQAEWLQPLIVRCFGIVWRANIASQFALIGEPPESLLDRPFSVKYLSPLARSQKQVEVDAMDTFEMNLFGTLGATGDASVLDVYDMDAAKRERASITSIPQKLIRDDKMVAQIREQRAQAAQQAKQEEMQTQNQLETQSAMADRIRTAK